MIHFWIISCALAEGFLTWFLVALIRENRRGASHAGKALRAKCGPAIRGGESIPLNPRTTDETAAKAMERAVTLPLHGQPTWTADFRENENRPNLTTRGRF
jgi:hypothetical protein